MFNRNPSLCQIHAGLVQTKNDLNNSIDYAETHEQKDTLSEWLEMVCDIKEQISDELTNQDLWGIGCNTCPYTGICYDCDVKWTCRDV